MAEATDYYALLGVARDAELPAIKAAYRHLAALHHPDHNQGDGGATTRFQVLVEAYSVLGHPARRAAYDAGRPIELLQSERGAPWAELFGRLLDPFLGVSDRVARQGRDTRYHLSLSLGEALLGCSRTLSLPKPETCKPCDGRGFDLLDPPSFCSRCSSVGTLVARPGLGRARIACPDCEGRGYGVEVPCSACCGSGASEVRQEVSIEVPAGASDGQRLRLQGSGAPGRYGGSAGDCFVALSVTEDPRFRVGGEDLFVNLSVAPEEAHDGGWTLVPTLEGPRRIRLPAGSLDGKVLRMAGHGLRKVQGARGDQFVTLQIKGAS